MFLWPRKCPVLVTVSCELGESVCSSVAGWHSLQMSVTSSWLMVLSEFPPASVFPSNGGVPNSPPVRVHTSVSLRTSTSFCPTPCTGPFRLSNYSCVSFGRLCLSGDWPISSRLSHFWAESSHYAFNILLIPVQSVVMVLLLFRILVIYIVSLFFLAWLKAYQFYPSFQRISIGCIIFSNDLLFSILLISAQISIVYFLWPTLMFLCLFSSGRS